MWSFRFWIIPLLFLLPTNISGQEAQKDFRKWKPDHYNLQFAGSIGWLSAGAGYSILKNKAIADLHYGFVPKSVGGPVHILAAKFTYQPFRISLKENITWFPLNPGFFLSYTFGKNFHLFWPREYYYPLYYWWSSALREHFSLNTTFKIQTEKIQYLDHVSLYFEVNTNDLYISSWFPNRATVPFGKIIKLGMGIRAAF